MRIKSWVASLLFVIHQGMKMNAGVYIQTILTTTLILSIFRSLDIEYLFRYFVAVAVALVIFKKFLLVHKIMTASTIKNNKDVRDMSFASRDSVDRTE